MLGPHPLAYNSTPTIENNFIYVEKIVWHQEREREGEGVGDKGMEREIGGWKEGWRER